MKKDLKTPCTVAELADKFGLCRTSQIGGSQKIIALEDDPVAARTGSLTYIDFNSPAGVYRCQASVVLVPHTLANFIPRDESCQVIPVDDPEQKFKEILQQLS